MIKLPWGMIAAVVGGLGLILTVVIMGYNLRAVKAELALATEREARWIEQQEQCDEEKLELKAALVEVDVKAEEIVILTARLQGSADATHDQAIERARAELELKSVEEKYARLSTRAVDMDVCQTYRLALAALAGGTQ